MYKLPDAVLGDGINDLHKRAEYYKVGIVHFQPMTSTITLL